MLTETYLGLCILDKPEDPGSLGSRDHPNQGRSTSHSYPRGSKYPMFKTLDPKTIPLMAFGTRILKYRVLGPSGYVVASLGVLAGSCGQMRFILEVPVRTSSLVKTSSYSYVCYVCVQIVIYTYICIYVYTLICRCVRVYVHVCGERGLKHY